YRRRGTAAVAVALESPSTLDECGRGLDVSLRDRSQLIGADAAHVGGAFERPGRRLVAQARGAAGVLVDESLVRVSFFEQRERYRERDYEVGAGPNLQM